MGRNDEAGLEPVGNLQGALGGMTPVGYEEQ